MQMLLGNKTIGLAEAWTILTAASAVAGISFLYGVLSPVGMNFLFLFGLEDILVATIYASLVILLIAFALAGLIAGSLWLLRLVRKNATFDDNWWISLPAFAAVTAAIVLLSMRFMSQSGSQTTVATLYVGPILVLLGLGSGLLCYRAFKAQLADLGGALQKLFWASVSCFLLLVAAPQEFGFFVGIYLWDGPIQLVRSDGNPDPMGAEMCRYDEQIIWISSKATMLRCGTNLVVVVGPSNLRASSLIVHRSR